MLVIMISLRGADDKNTVHESPEWQKAIKDGNWPLLSISDTYYTPLTYESLWYYTPSPSTTVIRPTHIAHAHAHVASWERYSNMQSLVIRTLGSAPLLPSSHPPCRPELLQTLRLCNFPGTSHRIWEHYNHRTLERLVFTIFPSRDTPRRPGHVVSTNQIHVLLKSIITVEPTFSFNSGAVHVALFPGHDRRPDHTAKKDTLALEDIVREISQQANRLESESNAHLQ